MPISGRIAQSSRLGFEDAREQRQLAEEVARNEDERQVRKVLALRRIGLDEQSQRDLQQRHGEQMDLQGRSLDLQDRGRRDVSNRAGLAQMGDDRKVLDEERTDQALETALNDPTTPPALKKIIGLRKIGINASPSAEMLLSPEELATTRQADEDADVRKAGRMAEAQYGAAAKFREPREPRQPASDMTPGQKFNATRQLRNDFTRETSAAREVTRQYQQMQAGIAAAQRGDLAAGSQAVLVTFQKILDPTSVVRESEYARSSAGQSLLNRIEGAADRLARGGAGVPLAELQRFAALAEQFAKNQAQAAQEAKTQVDAIASEFGIDSALITREVGPAGGGTATLGAGDTDPLGIRRPK